MLFSNVYETRATSWYNLGYYIEILVCTSSAEGYGQTVACIRFHSIADLLELVDLLDNILRVLPGQGDISRSSQCLYSKTRLPLFSHTWYDSLEPQYHPCHW